LRARANNKPYIKHSGQAFKDVAGANARDFGLVGEICHRHEPARKNCPVNSGPNVEEVTGAFDRPSESQQLHATQQ